eukprot:8768667-Pyramimonas_sp.AAC.1
MRAVLVTFRGWEIWREALQQKAIEHRPLRHVLQDGPSPRFWQNISFVEQLAEAAQGFPSCRRVASAGKDAIDLGTPLLAEPPAAAPRSCPPKIQRLITSSLAASLFPDTLHETFAARLVKWFPGHRGRIIAID